MDELNYQPNSHKYKAEQQEATVEKKKVEKVITGTAKTKKKSGIVKLTGAIVSEDAKNVKSYILTDVMIPAFKKLVSDVVTNGVDMLIYGESGRRRNSSTSSKISYRNYYDRRDDERRYSESSRARSNYSYDDIVLESRGDAVDVLDRMNELIETYKVASVADLYDLVGITGDYTDNKYGWTSLRGADTRRVRDGYLLVLPKALPIN